MDNFCVILESSLTALLNWEEEEIRSTHLRCSVKIKTLTQVFCCEYCKISKKTYFEEQLQAAASEQYSPNKTIVLVLITFGSFIHALRLNSFKCPAPVIFSLWYCFVSLFNFWKLIFSYSDPWNASIICINNGEPEQIFWKCLITCSCQF